MRYPPATRPALGPVTSNVWWYRPRAVPALEPPRWGSGARPGRLRPALLLTDLVGGHLVAAGGFAVAGRHACTRPTVGCRGMPQKSHANPTAMPPCVLPKMRPRWGPMSAFLGTRSGSATDNAGSGADNAACRLAAARRAGKASRTPITGEAATPVGDLDSVRAPEGLFWLRLTGLRPRFRGRLGGCILWVHNEVSRVVRFAVLDSGESFRPTGDRIVV